jgi:glycine cleavage system H lipoate-binding protein
MSILFVLLMFLLILSISYFTREKQPLRTQPVAGPRVPRFEREYGFEIPQNYAFHPGHTWVVKEGPDSARIGLDSFAANLIGKIDHIDVIGQNRWVRQGQKIMTLKSGSTTIDLMSPVEGVITAVNPEALEDPSLVTRDPYKNGWIAMIKSPELDINQKNLVQGVMVAPWMQNNVTRLNAMLGQLSPALAQDGGLPLSGLLARVAPELRKKLVQEFFLN